jgi:hypothetical protein
MYECIYYIKEKNANANAKRVAYGHQTSKTYPMELLSSYSNLAGQRSL